MFRKTGLFWVFGVFCLLWMVGACPVFGAGRVILRGHVPSAVAQLTSQGRLPETNLLHLTLSLPLRNQPELDEFLHELQDPASANFHKYLTPQEFTARFGPAQSDYDTLLEFVRTNGFQVTGTQPNRLLVDVTGTAATVERVFAVMLRKYRHPKEARDFYSPDNDPSVASPVTLLDVTGMNNYSLPHPNLKLRPLVSPSAMPQAGSGPGGSYRGNDFRAAYVPGTTLTGAGQSVGLLQYDGYYSNDIASYISQAGISTGVSLVNVPVNGGVSKPGGGTAEVALDIEMAIAMAPGLSKIYVYEGPNSSTSWSTILSKMANDNLAKQLSCSWGGGSRESASEQIFKQMAAQGQSFFNASGDDDAFTGTVPFPSDSTNITQVGGTTLSMNGGSYASETTWNWGGGSGSSGGVSTYYKIPNWQTNISMTANNGSTTYRNIPDVALTGDNVFVVYSNGITGTFGGTSCAAPLWAGYTALINQQAALATLPPVGFLNPALYAMANTVSYNNNFHDVTTGDNTSTASPSKYYAVAGYDLCTGLGTPNGTNLINALAPLVFAPAIAGNGWKLIAESATPTNGAIDPGETVTLNFILQNSGNLATTNLTATLQANANVLAPSAAQNYGALAAFGGMNSRAFTFTAAGDCGSNITATLQLLDGTNNLGNVSFTLPLGSTSGLMENFDAVNSPVLPANWTSVNVFSNANSWATTSAAFDTSPNSVFITDSATMGENALVSPVIPIISANAQLSFRHNYSFEYSGNRNPIYYDGGVLEIKIGGGAFTDFVAAGGSFTTNGYNGTITITSGNPLGGRAAWCKTSSGWKTVTAKLPASAAGQTIQLRWNCATDSENGGGGSPVGWYVDSVAITDTAANCLTVLTDIAVSQSLATNSFTAGQNLVYILSVTNAGPQPAANLVVTDTVPVNAAFASASSGGVFSAGTATFSAGMLPVGGSTNFALTLSPTVGSVFTNVVTVATVTPEISTTDNQSTLIFTQAVASVLPNPSPDIASASVQADGSFALNFNGLAEVTYILETTTNLLFPDGWQPVATNAAVTNGIFQFTDPQATNFPLRFYRLKLAP